MRRAALVLYVAWCALMLFGYAAAQGSGYSPFADGGRSAFFYARGGGGPQHK